MTFGIFFGMFIVPICILALGLICFKIVEKKEKKTIEKVNEGGTNE